MAAQVARGNRARSGAKQAEDGRADSKDGNEAAGAKWHGGLDNRRSAQHMATGAVTGSPRIAAAFRSNPTPMTARALDLLGLKCPLPALKTRKALKELQPGERLVVTCSDPMAAIDIPNLIRETGDRLLAEHREEARLVFEIEKR
jgi:tRNA 2-thiouridine synthesizing protein A